MVRLGIKDIQARLDEVMQSFIKEFHPQRIIVFGSFARGTAHENSSVDILVVASTQEPFYERTKKAIRISDGDPPVEPIIYTPGEINLLLSERDSFINSIFAEGVLLYSK